MRIRSLLQGKKRYLAAAVVAASLGGGAYAFAASLSITTNSLGSGTAGVTNTCNLVTTYNASYSNNSYQVTTINVSEAATDSPATSCDNLYYRVTAADGSGNKLEEWTGQLSASGTATLTVSPAGTVPAATLGNITAVVESNNQP